MPNKAFNLEYQYQIYLEMVGLNEARMHPVQQSETKRAFMGGVGQMIILLHNDIPQLSANMAVNTLQDMANQVGVFFKNEIAKNG